MATADELLTDGIDVSKSAEVEDTSNVATYLGIGADGKNMLRVPPHVAPKGKRITWTSSSDANDYTTAGVYEIAGERLSASDNLPIQNSNPGHTINGRLTVLNSSLSSGTGEIDDKCITQILSLSNRTGSDGNVYVRTAYGATLGSLTWKSWGKLQTNIEVGSVETLDILTDNGIYSGVWLPDNYNAYTFVCITINDYMLPVSPRRVSQFVYRLSKMDGAVDVITRHGSGDDVINWDDWKVVGEDYVKSIEAELLKRIQGISEKSNPSTEPFKLLVEVGDINVKDENGVNIILKALDGLHSTNPSDNYEGRWRIIASGNAFDVENIVVHFATDKWIQVMHAPFTISKTGFSFGSVFRYKTSMRLFEGGVWSDWYCREDELQESIETLPVEFMQSYDIALRDRVHEYKLPRVLKEGMIVNIELKSITKGESNVSVTQYQVFVVKGTYQYQLGYLNFSKPSLTVQMPFDTVDTRILVWSINTNDTPTGDVVNITLSIKNTTLPRYIRDNSNTSYVDAHLIGTTHHYGFGKIIPKGTNLRLQWMNPKTDVIPHVYIRDLESDTNKEVCSFQAGVTSVDVSLTHSTNRIWVFSSAIPETQLNTFRIIFLDEPVWKEIEDLRAQISNLQIEINNLKA